MRRIAAYVVVASAVVAFSSPTFAQGRGRGFGFGGVGMLLGNASVQQELKMDEAQITKAKDLAASLQEKMAENRSKLEGLDQQERREKMMELNRELNTHAMKSAGEFLKAEQVTRLKQIQLQIQGAQALASPEVQAKLGLTDAQKSDIQSILEDSRAEMREIFQDNQDDQEARMKKMTELRKQTLAKAEAKLNDEQQKTWKSLVGSPFEIKWERPAN